MTMNISELLLDGYKMSSSDGYNVVSKWFDVWQHKHVGITVKFTSGSPNGTVKLQVSDDVQNENQTTTPSLAGSSGIGNIFRGPASCTNLISDPLDVIDLPAIAGLGEVTQTVSGTGTFILSRALLTHRWIRIKFTQTGSPNTTSVIDARITAKR